MSICREALTSVNLDRPFIMYERVAGGLRDSRLGRCVEKLHGMFHSFLVA